MQERAVPTNKAQERFRIPRLALPTKLFISYLIVVAIGAVPTFLYVRNELQEDLLRLTEERLRASTRRAAAALMPFSERDLLDRMRTISSVIPERSTLIAPSGEVLFDSASNTNDDHLGRPEVQQALSARALLDVAVVVRFSETTGRETMYAATRIVDGGPLLRLAMPVDEIIDAARALKSFARNVQAIAISVALGFSLLAALLFLRPLLRVVETARAYGNGDLSARTTVHADDEVGDVARALDQMAVDLRRRLANAGSGDAIVAQLVDALPVPCVVIETDGEVLAINGAARRALNVEGTSARRRVKELIQNGRFQRALEEAEADGDPEPVVLPVAEGVRFEGLVHVLKRPGNAPLTVLLGHEAPAETSTTLPPVSAVTARDFDAVLAEARERARPLLTSANVMVEVDDSPGVLLADVDHRLGRALALALEGCARALQGRLDVLAVAVHVEPTRVRVDLDAVPDTGFVDAVRPLLAPLGGDVMVDDKGARLWLPRA